MPTTVPPARNPDLQLAITTCRTAFDAAWIDELFPRAPNAVYTASVITHLMVYQRLQGNVTLNEAVAELLRCLDRLPEHRRVDDATLSANSGAYSRARSALPVPVVHQIADTLSRQQYEAYPPSFGTRRAFLFDGSTVLVPHTPELCAAFPPTRNQHGTSHWPIVRLLVAHELASGCALRPEYGPVNGSKPVDEVRMALRMCDRLPPRSLVIGDCNFGIFAFVYGFYAAGHEVLTRLSTPRFTALTRQARRVAEGQWELHWKPSRADRHSHPELPPDAHVTIHLYEVAIHPTLTLYLAATVAQPSHVWSAAYHLRQRVETDIFDVKETLALDQTRAQSVAMWEKEACLGYVAYNLVVQVRRLAGQYAQIEPRRLSFSGTRSLVEKLLLQATVLTAGEWEILLDRVLRGAAQRKLPQRANPNRQYPRTVLSRPRKHPVRSRPPATAPPTNATQRNDPGASAETLGDTK